MSKSDLIRLENSGILKKIKVLSFLDDKNGIIDNGKSKLTNSVKSGLDMFSAGAYDEQYGLNIVNSVLRVNGMSAVKAYREKGTAFFEIEIISPFYKKEIVIKYPHGGYK